MYFQRKETVVLSFVSANVFWEESQDANAWMSTNNAGGPT
jgi:hypothetical protein